MMNNKTALLSVNQICKSFKKDSSQALLVLKDVNFTLYEGEIVALLGKSGSGKSTLLRIIAGLVRPSSGEVIYRNQPLSGPANGIAMVFQHFALLPWLTVLQNVELGLEAKGISQKKRRSLALKAIDTVGLDGFESALPKELSGGMCQRVGFARALVVEPDILLMDEPFSALDVLTAENLRSDLLDLWQARKTQNRASGMILVTHNIEEAAMLADRIIIFDSDPGCVRSELPIALPHPRDEQTLGFRKVVDQIYTLMTGSGKIGIETEKYKDIGIGYRLPDVEIAELIGLLETIDDEGKQGRMDLPELAESTQLDVDELFPLTEALEILRFATVSEGDIQMTLAGKRFSELDMLAQKPFLLDT